ncbi:Asp-tRNA(Asn)/Glu-tRNA(Gln) amidotransferase subunit GatC [Candidatus Gribaldobacteria bacterium]|nr:Asp-tRNA(Asn)/Glu-tRNA(Gln) amidotransferase subunit GatC [Candidatus Gribaldobacteria bacterium]
MLSKQDVQKIADLARLELTEDELAKMQQDLGEILSYIELLKEVDVDLIKPLIGLNEINSLRNDDVFSSSTETRENIIRQFTQKQENYLKVKKILE